MWERHLKPVTPDPDSPPDYPEGGYEYYFEEVNRVGAGQALEIPGDSACDFMVGGIIEFGAPATQAPTEVTDDKLVIRNNDYNREYPLLFTIT
ncbi:hypothetical protein [Peribacillus sp. FSL R5-0717]|uniref:hypothetical protein n=1 Tax=Peribacillus sp. FSL R5-0717 TaxID=2975308 RepID=UPI0030F817C9